MSPRKRVGKSTRLSDEDHALLVKQAQRDKLDMSILLGTLIGMNKKFKFTRPKWSKGFNKWLTENQYQFLDPEDQCDHQAWRDGGFVCIWPNLDKPPSIKKLGIDIKKNCQKCTELRKGLAEKEQLKKVNLNLKEQLKTKELMKNKVPICNSGAVLTAGGLEFRGCRKAPGRNVSIPNYCKVLSSGLPCQLFAEISMSLVEKSV